MIINRILCFTIINQNDTTSLFIKSKPVIYETSIRFGLHINVDDSGIPKSSVVPIAGFPDLFIIWKEFFYLE